LNNILQSERSIHGRWLALVGGCPNRHGEGSHRLRPQQRTVVGFDGPVTFADGFMQGFNIGDLNMAPRILYHSSLLKVRACSVTLVRLTPNISARNSWVNCRLAAFFCCSFPLVRVSGAMKPIGRNSEIP